VKENLIGLPVKTSCFLRALNHLIAAFRSNANGLDLSGTYIPTELKIQNAFTHLELSHAHIKGKFIFQNAGISVSACETVFSNDVEFKSGSSFNVDISNSYFKKDLIIDAVHGDVLLAEKCFFETKVSIVNSVLEKCVFKGSPSPIVFLINASSFTKELDVSGVEFQKESVFTEANVPGISIFNGVSIPDNMKFNQCNFGSNGCFRGIKTGEGVVFSGCKFGEKTSFAKFGRRLTEFGKRNTFKGTHLGNESNFSGCKFGAGFLFESGHIGKGCDFSNAQFGPSLKFEDVNIQHASFSGSKFENRASFIQCKFYNSTDFSGVSFVKTSEENSLLLFDDASFSGVTNFSKSKFDGPVSFNGGEFKGIDFSGGMFLSSVDFTNRNFKGPTVFSDCVFEVAPQFHGATLFQDTVFTDAKFNDVGRIKQGAASAAASYRTLRHAMEKDRSRRNQSIFYALEMRSARNSGEVRRTAFILSFLYDWLSEYGLRTGRPLWWLLGINAAWTLIYFVIGLFFKKLSFYACIQFTMEQLTRPFYVWRGAYKPLEELRYIWSDVSGAFQVLASLQSLISIGLITLLVLAIRRQFKMD